MIKPKVFRPVMQKIDGETDSLKINLVFIDTKKNRQAVIDNGFMREIDLNYATTHLEAENNDYCKYNDIYRLLQAEFGGITVENGRIYVRGGKTSFSPGATHALIVVNGHPNDNIEWLRPCEVKSIRILKDGDGAIYGSRGGNGVVVISTR